MPRTAQIAEAQRVSYIENKTGFHRRNNPLLR